jgi:hypothetical protein
MAKSVSTQPPGLPLGGLLRRAAPLLTIAGVIVGGTYWAWSRQQARIEAEGHYQIALSDIRITPVPEWITTDVIAEALRDASLDPPLSALDPTLAERVAKALAFHPWIAEVRRVRTLTGGLEIDVDYRRPVCMVELPPNNGKRGLYAVDIVGTLLPSRDFLDEPKKAASYPRLGGFVPAEVGRVGLKWPDARILEGAKVAVALHPVWAKLNLAKIAPQESSTATSSTPGFELLTNDGSRVVWGRAPGSEAKGEMLADNKIESLVRYVADHGSLEGRDGPQQLDVRGAQLVIVAELEKPKAGDDDASAAKPTTVKQK